jgi:hypothetical protein
MGVKSHTFHGQVLSALVVVESMGFTWGQFGRRGMVQLRWRWVSRKYDAAAGFSVVFSNTSYQASV